MVQNKSLSPFSVTIATLNFINTSISHFEYHGCFSNTLSAEIGESNFPFFCQISTLTHVALSMIVSTFICCLTFVSWINVHNLEFIISQVGGVKLIK